MVLALKRPIDCYIGERVRAFRERQGLSLEVLASRVVGMTPTQLGAYESGERIAPRTLYALAQTLDVPLALFFAADLPREQPVDELAPFASPETTELLRVWQRLAVDARRRALLVVQAVAGK
jgi:transcriptional regulator with XRE-family HTH domain